MKAFLGNKLHARLSFLLRITSVRTALLRRIATKMGVRFRGGARRVMRHNQPIVLQYRPFPVPAVHIEKHLEEKTAVLSLASVYHREEIPAAALRESSVLLDLFVKHRPEARMFPAHALKILRG